MIQATGREDLSEDQGHCCPVSTEISNTHNLSNTSSLSKGSLMKSTAYQQAGVSLDAADEVVDKVKPLAQRTFRPGVIGGLGGFGGLFHLDPNKWKNPVLVSGTDGVGTKLKLAFELEKHDTIGIDLVAMCVNDILVQGAEPLYFLDYLACGKLHPDKVATIVSGISEGCRQSNCALIGGETAEMPGMYSGEDYDLADLQWEWWKRKS